MIKVAVLDDYQEVFQQIIDIEKFKEKYEFKVFNEPFSDENEAIVAPAPGKTPIKKPEKKKIRIIEDLENPIVLKIAISWVLFLTNITKPEIMFSAAIRTTNDHIMNIAFLSTSNAERKEFEACFQFHNV